MYSLDTTDTFLDALEVGVAVGHVLPVGLCDYGKNHNHDYFGQ